MNLPALLGGTPLRPKGPPVWPPADPAILDAMQRAFAEGWWGKYDSDQCERLRQWTREYHNVEHVILCGSGNYAVELALRAVKVGAGDEVILADYDYPGNFLSIHVVGATPVLVDVAPSNWNLSLDAVREAMGLKVKAILVSHLHGGRVDMAGLMDLAREKGIIVVEDAAQAPGALIDGHRAGTRGDVGILSFGGSKLLTAGRGGAIMTPHADIAQRARNHLLRAGNIVCPLTELQAALLLPQCLKLDERNATRWRNVQAFCSSLTDLPGVRPFVSTDGPAMPAFYKLGIQLNEEDFGLHRTRVIEAMRAEGFAVDEGFAVAHFQRSPKRFRQGSALSESERAHAGCVQVHHPILLESAADMDQLAEAWKRIHAHAPALHQS